RRPRAQPARSGSRPTVGHPHAFHHTLGQTERCGQSRRRHGGRSSSRRPTPIGDTDVETNMTDASATRVVELPERLPQARHRLDPRAKQLWRLGSAIGGLVTTVIVALGAFGLQRLAEFEMRWAWVAVGVTL